MYNIKLLNKISKVGLDGFDENYAYSEEMTNEDAILVRSASLHEYDFGENLKAIARAGAGVIIFHLMIVVKKELLYLIHREQMLTLLKNLYYVDYFSLQEKLLKVFVGLMV